MQVAIIGSGVVGITSAYYLAKAGHDVSIFDRCSSAAQETSYANGAQLSYSHATPWADPNVVPKLLKWFGDDNAPLVFRLRPELHLYRWGLSFLKHCTQQQNQRGAAHIWRLASYSRAVLHELLAEESISFDWINKGILHIFQDSSEFAGSIKSAQYLETLGCPFKILDKQGCLDKEPILASQESSIQGGIHYPLDEVGNIFTFTQTLADIIKRHNVAFHYNTSISEILTRGKHISGIVTNKGLFEFDAYILAAGAMSGTLTKPLGLYLPIYPLKGYTLTLSLPSSSDLPLPNASITDQAHKIVYTRLGNTLRIAGTAEVAGFDNQIRHARIDLMKKQAAKMFPMYKDLLQQNQHTQEWACLRSSTPSGIPIIGKTPFENLFLNTGHGSLGWTLALGSAKLLNDIIQNNRTEISTEGYTLS